jgi:hypothetical protein
MTTEIRDALTAVRDAVHVPPVDDLRFRELVRSERRRRTGGRVLAGLAAATVVGVVGTLVVTGADDDRRADVADTPGSAAFTASIPVSIDDRLALVTADGSVLRSGVRVEDVVGTTSQGVVVVGRDSHVRLVPVDGSGERATFGEPRDLVGAPVQSAHLDKQGLFLGFVDLGDTLHLREVGAETDYESSPVEPTDRVLSIDGGRWMTDSESEGLVLHDHGSSTQIGPAFPAITAELADITVAVGTSDGVEVFEPSDGTPRFGGSLGGEVSSLAPGGGLVATATGAEQSDQGMSVEVWLLDAFTGEQAPMRGFDGGPARDIAWVDDDEFAVLAGIGEDELWVCSADQRRCELRLSRPANALRLPTS